MRALLAVLLILTAAGLGAEARTSYGLAAGLETGFGFSLRNDDGDQGYQVTGIPVIGSGGTFVSLGLQGFRTFHETPMTRFFGYLGASVVYVSGRPMASTGLGYGLELIVLDHLVFDVQFGLGLGWDYGAINAGFRTQGGLFYRL